MLIPTVLALIAAPKVDLDVVYSRVAGEELRMDIYHPANAAPKDNPAILVVHGGGWVMGRRQDMTEMCVRLAEMGFVAATVQYRLAPKHRWPAMLDDVQTAVRYLRANAADLKIDPKRIGAAGASAGGHLSLMLGYRDTRDPKPAEFPKESSRVAAVLNLFGPTDMLNDYPPQMEMLMVQVLGKRRPEADPDLKQASPINHISSDDAPTFIFHGTADPLVPLKQSQRLEEALRKARVPFETAYIEGLGHNIRSEDAKVSEKAMEALMRGVDFLKKHLRVRETAKTGGKEAA